MRSAHPCTDISPRSRPVFMNYNPKAVRQTTARRTCDRHGVQIKAAVVGRSRTMKTRRSPGRKQRVPPSLARRQQPVAAAILCENADSACSAINVITAETAEPLGRAAETVSASDSTPVDVGCEITLMNLSIGARCTTTIEWMFTTWFYLFLHLWTLVTTTMSEPGSR